MAGNKSMDNTSRLVSNQYEVVTFPGDISEVILVENYVLMIQA